MGTLEGRIAIVTGGGAGIGLAIAQELAAAGCGVAVAERDAAAGEAAVESLRAAGAQARSYAADVSVAADVDTAFAAVAKDFGRLDIVVNNAGVSHVGPAIAETTDEAWAESVAVMQTGVFYCLRAAARHLLPQGSGSVVNISSIRGFSPNPGRIAYCATKAAVLMMTRVAAGEWAGSGVRVNAIAPGIQRTPMWDADVERGAIDEPFYLRTVPMGRIGDPREVGRLAVYLCSDDAAYVTGGCFTIDGGLTSIPAG
jgi:NAD(P)-dependent dehydrogenase (short-subunit alcohol dehydrogenase family)